MWLRRGFLQVKRTLQETSDAPRQPPFSAWSFGTSPTAAIKKKILLKFARDRRRYLRWVFEATKRFGLSVLNVSGRGLVLGARYKRRPH